MPGSVGNSMSGRMPNNAHVLTVVIFINNLPVIGSVQYSSTVVWHQFIVIRPEFRRHLVGVVTYKLTGMRIPG